MFCLTESAECMNKFQKKFLSLTAVSVGFLSYWVYCRLILGSFGNFQKTKTYFVPDESDKFGVK